jgi:hypothetical protein
MKTGAVQIVWENQGYMKKMGYANYFDIIVVNAQQIVQVV